MNIYLNENTWNKFLHPQTDLAKEKIYVENPSDVPKNYSLLRGPKGGLYYDTTRQEHEKFEFPDTKEKRQAIINYDTEKQVMNDFLEGLRDVRQEGMSRLDQYVSYLDGKTYQLGKNIIETQSNLLNRAGINKNIIEKLTDETTDKLIYQEMRSWERQLGDHGIRHIEGNLRFFNQIFEKFKNEECRGALCQVSEKDKLLTYIVMINHDIGYTVEPSRTNIVGTKYHKEFSESWFEKERNIYEPILGKEDFERAKKYILLHDTPEIDWEKEPILSAISISDNLALFYNEKLPTLFKKVPNALLLLFKMQEALQLKDNNKFLEYKNNLEKEIDATNYPEYTKYLLKRAAKEVSPYTPPVTLSMLAGEISSIDYKKDSGLNVGIKYDKFEKEINKLYDQGQSKFIKLAESYGIKDFNKSKFDFIKNNKKLLSIFIENPDDIEKKLSIIRRKNKYCLVSDKAGTLNCDQNKSKLEAQHKAIIINEQDSNDIQKTDISGIIIKGLIDQNSINKERRIFSGFGSVAVIDRQGDYLPIHEFKPVMEKLMQRGAPVTDSHSNHVVGKIVDYTYKPTESGELGLYLTAEIYNHYPSDEETWHKIQDGEYTGFSLGGKAGTKTPTCNNIGCYNILGEIEAWEFSIVERPANQLANIDKVNKLAKASDVVDEVISSIIQKERIYIKTPAEAPRNTQVYTGERGGKYYETEELPKSEKEKVERQQRSPDIKVKSLEEVIGKERYNYMQKTAEGKQLSELLNNYSEIASGKASDEIVTKTYDFINGRLDNVSKFYKDTIDNRQEYLNQLASKGRQDYLKLYNIDLNTDAAEIKRTSEDLQAHLNIYNNIEKVKNLFNRAKNRQDKVLAIDAFIHTAHTGGSSLIGRLWNIKTGLKNGEKPILDSLVLESAHEYIYELSKNIGKSYVIKDGHIIQKPFAGYKDFEQCVAENKDKGDPNAYCGAIKHKVEKRADFTLDDAKRIGDKLNIDWTKIDQNEFLIGLNIELEHGTKFPETNVTDDDEIATAKIVLAHINEYPDYYNEQNGLPEMEKRLKGIKKGRIYVDNPQDAPKDKKVQEGERGGIYYESEGQKQTTPKPKLSMTEYFKRISELTGTKVKMGNPITRALYEGYSIDVGHWLTTEEFENELKLRQKHESEGKISSKEPKEIYNLKEKIIPFIDKLKQYSKEYLNDKNLKLSEDAKNIAQSLENNNLDDAINIFRNSDLKYDIGNTYQALNKIKDEKYIAENFGLDWGTKPGTYEVYRSGNLDGIRGIFTSIDEVGAKAYGPNVKKYKVNIKNPLVADDLRDAYEKLIGKKIDIISGNEQWMEIDKKVFEIAKKKGYDAITYINPAPPAKRELVIFNSSSIINN